MESAIEVIIWSFLFVGPFESSPWQREPDGRAVTTHVAFLLRLDMMVSLASQCPGPRTDRKWRSLGPFDPKPLEDLARAARATYTKRNNIVHGLWSPVGARALRQSHRARGAVVPLYEILTPKQVAQIATEAQKLAAQAEALCGDLSAYLRTEASTFP